MIAEIALLAIFGRLAAEDAEANTIDSYLQEQACEACKALDPEDAKILEGVKSLETAHEHEVILYHALPFYVYALAWIWHGISNEDLLNWKPVAAFHPPPYPVAKMPISLRVFDDGQLFPPFQAADGKVCVPVVGMTQVKEVGPSAEQLGVGRIMSTADGGRKIGVQYDKETKEYVADEGGCFPLIDIQKHAQAKYADSLLEDALAKHGVENATSFESYLTELGVWKASREGGSTPDHIAGVRERLLSVNLNVFGSWKDGWTDCTWDIFRGQGTTFVSFGRGGHVPFVEEILAQKKTPPEVQELVQKQLQLLTCVAKNRTSEPGTVTGCDKLVNDMKYMVSCTTATDLQQLMSVALPPQDGPCKKVESNHPQADANTKCGTDVLLQLIMDPDLANEIAYISQAGGIPDDAWKGQSFMAAYNALKNRPTGDSVQARVLLRRDPFFSGVGINVFAAHSSVFRDTEMMYALASLATDIRDTVLGHTQSCLTTSTTTTTATTTTTTAWISPFHGAGTHPFRLVAVLAIAALAVASLCYYRLSRAAPARDGRAIELPERV